MKISKLFHWLYASLMLLPLMVFGVTGLYYGLNQNAQLSERTEQQPIYYQTNEVNTYTDLQQNRVYFYSDNFSTPLENVDSIKAMFSIKNTDNLTFIENRSNVSLLRFDIRDNGYPYLRIEYSDNTSTRNLPINNQPFDFVIDNYLSNYSYAENIITYFSESNLQLVESYTPIVYNNDISTSIINAWNSTWQNPLFSWSSDSFLIAPFNYITDLFSIPQNNTFSMALSYWLSISIVYLVFDLVMYVPLLAHRWIDKGMVE